MRFNPRRPRGRRPWVSRALTGWPCFNPRRPRGRRHIPTIETPDPQTVSIHAAREGGDIWRRSSRATQFVSIHAAREGGDKVLRVNVQEAAVSIHAAREGGDYAASPICL